MRIEEGKIYNSEEIDDFLDSDDFTTIPVIFESEFNCEENNEYALKEECIIDYNNLKYYEDEYTDDEPHLAVLIKKLKIEDKKLSAGEVINIKFNEYGIPYYTALY